MESETKRKIDVWFDVAKIFGLFAFGILGYLIQQDVALIQVDSSAINNAKQEQIFWEELFLLAERSNNDAKAIGLLGAKARNANVKARVYLLRDKVKGETTIAGRGYDAWDEWAQSVAYRKDMNRSIVLTIQRFDNFTLKLNLLARALKIEGWEEFKKVKKMNTKWAEASRLATDVDESFEAFYEKATSPKWRDNLNYFKPSNGDAPYIDEIQKLFDVNYKR